MGFIELFLIGVGLSMDAFAVSVCKGLNMRKINYKHALIIGGFFGGFQALMPFVGWALGSQFEQYIESVDHWIAFVLLALVGAKMMKESFESASCDTTNRHFGFKTMLVLAVATSIDALAVGVSFAFVEFSSISSWLAVALIGLITFFVCVLGVQIGHKLSHRAAFLGKKAEFIGGAV